MCALSTQGVGGSSSEVLPETGDWRVELLSAVSRNCIPLMPFDNAYLPLPDLLLSPVTRYCLSTLGATGEKQISPAASGSS